MEMVAERGGHADTEEGDAGPGCPEVVYTTLPEGLIELPRAAREYEIPSPTLHRWLSTGKIVSHGRLKASARGGGLILLSEQEVLEYKHGPRSKGGRPPKIR